MDERTTFEVHGGAAARAAGDGIDRARIAEIAHAAAESDEYRTEPLPAEVAGELTRPFSAFAHLSHTHRGYVERHLDAGVDADAALEACWDAALDAGALRYYEGKIVFPLCALCADGATPVEVSLCRADPDRPVGTPWRVGYVIDRPRAVQTAPSKALEQFAWLGPWEEFLGTLAAVALPEAWGFGDEEEGRELPILKSYIRMTYYRLAAEDKVRVSDDGSFAAFNTGLVDARFDDIFACFEPNAAGRTPWRFVGFAAAGSRALKKRVARCFNPLPQPARYFTRIEDMLFDPDRQLVVDYEHILLDNMSRLPTTFLEEELCRSAEAREALARVEAVPAQERAALYAELADVIDTDSRLFRQLRNRLEDAVEVARRRVRWNFKTAVPSYYPRADAMSLLLPLCLVDDVHADAALVVQLQPSGAYQGQTILTMRQAYTNARLVCRPDSDWLIANAPRE